MKKSIMPDNEIYSNVPIPYWHKHHIFEGRNRQNSDKYGLFVWLLPELHNMSNAGVHFNKNFDNWLKEIGQTAFEEHYPELDFLSIFKKNYK